MGLFDILGTGDQTKAANDQIMGINAGLSGLGSDIQSGNNALTTNFGQGAQALNTNYMAGLQPFMQNYGTAYNGYNTGSTALNDALGLNGAAGSAAALQSWQNNPALTSALTMGNNAVNAWEEANGKAASGNQLIDLSKNDMNIANQNWGQYIGNLEQAQGQYGTQAGNAASGAGQLYSGLGNQLNFNNMGLGGALNSNWNTLGNATYGADTSIGNALANKDLSGLGASANSLGAIGGIMSGLMGFLPSDIRVKEDIEPVGELHDGQTVYKYRYKGDPTPQIGLMAQEVEDHIPDAVMEIGGIKHVNYDRATSLAADLGRYM